MPRSALTLFTALLQLACVAPFELPTTTPTDDMRRAAQDLRWTKQTQAIARIDMTDFTPPIIVLAVPPGKHDLRTLEPLISLLTGSRLAAP